MSRMFSSTARAVKALKWELNGTTEPVDWAKRIMERVVDQVPKLSESADRAVINGNPHSTGEDPYHVSGVIDGTVTFSNKKFPTVKDSLAEEEMPTDGMQTTQSEAVPTEQTMVWEWDAHTKMSKRWDTDLELWVFWDEAESRSKYWDGNKWVWK